MKILVSSHHFAPSVGGIEESSRLLAEAWTASGHEVRVVTQTSDPAGGAYSYPVIRNPTAVSLLREVSWCDIYFQNNISLQTLWPSIILRKPTVITHQTWLPGGFGGILKHTACRLVSRTVAISNSVRQETDADLVIPNPYRNDLFHEEAQVDESHGKRDLIFVGRLVSDKGCDLLLEALLLLGERGVRPSLTIVGTGPEEPLLRQYVSRQGLEKEVIFAEKKTGSELACLLRNHRVLTVPSRWKEPFGIVALEGIACGCAVIGSSGGGLPEAIGPCGLLFENGDPKMLADQLESLLITKSTGEFRNPTLRLLHLEKHTPFRIAKEYLLLFEQILATRCR
jgi:glycosyltransferase involved in cell wall biosynthesis